MTEKPETGSNPLESFIKILDDTKEDYKNELKKESESLKEEFNKTYAEEIKKLKPEGVTVKLNDVEIFKSPKELYHNKFDEVLKCVHADIPVFMTGDAGSGKTTIAEQVATSLKLEFYCISVCVQTSEVAFLGYKNAHGDYVSTLFRKAYEEGGIFLIDEIDNGNPNVLSVLNSSLSNTLCAFPDKMVTKHKDFRLIATGNTIGRGASREYVGRLEMDLATLDRFAVVTIDYDESIENTISNPEIAKEVQKIRKVVNEKSIRLIVSPRASINISKLISTGVSYIDALDICIFKGCEKNIRDQIFAGGIQKFIKRQAVSSSSSDVIIEAEYADPSSVPF